MANLSSTVPGLIISAPLTLVTIHAIKVRPLQHGNAAACKKAEGFHPAAALDAITDPVQIESALADVAAEVLRDEPPRDEPLGYGEIQHLLETVRRRHSVDQARHVIMRAGGEERLASIPPSRFAQVKKACMWLLNQPKSRGTSIHLFATTGDPL